MLRSARKQLFKSVELGSGDGLEMAEHSALTLRRDCIVIVNSYHCLELYVFVCILTKITCAAGDNI